MDFLDRLYSSNYFGIGLFAVIAFLVVTFLIVLFFGKKDEKKRNLEATKNLNTEDTFKETSTPTPVEIPSNPEPVAPINLEPTVPEQETPVVPSIEPVQPIVDNTLVDTVTPVMPVPPVAPISYNDNDYVDNLTVEEPQPSVPTIETPKVEPIITPVPATEEPKVEAPIKLEPTKIEAPTEPITPIIKEEPTINNETIIPTKTEEVTPIIKEEEPKLQINEEPVLNTYYKPVEKNEAEPIKVPNIDFDAIAESISKELDELESDSKKYEDVKVTPIREVTSHETERSPQTFSSVYVKEEPTQSSKVELPKRIDLPARKSE